MWEIPLVITNRLVTSWLQLGCKPHATPSASRVGNPVSNHEYGKNFLVMSRAQATWHVPSARRVGDPVSNHKQPSNFLVTARAQGTYSSHVCLMCVAPTAAEQRTKFGERAFSHASAGSATWNALLDHIRTVVKFRKLLILHCFVKLLILVDFCVFSCFSIWLTFVMHLWSRSS